MHDFFGIIVLCIEITVSGIYLQGLKCCVANGMEMMQGKNSCLFNVTVMNRARGGCTTLPLCPVLTFHNCLV